MEEILKNLDSEKRDRIINSALEEFSENSFDKASTNNIVKNANISKGLLFHYFGNKKELYDKLEIFVLETVATAIADNMNWEVTDFFERIKQIVMIKGELTYQYPYIYEFAYALMAKKSFEELKASSKKVSPNLVEKVYRYNIDFSLFREDVDINKMMNIIMWTFEKLGEELLKKQMTKKYKFNYDEMEKEVETYIELLRKAFYK